jgi:cellulose synthase/poly-beta-1,6-N-acetylglucosamine synthase-like glycosyltransferase
MVITLLQIMQIVCLSIILLFLALLLWGLRRRRFPASDWQPYVSVLVAARNEEANLAACLASLAAQDYTADRSEFIIIDDASTDGTGNIIAEWAARDARFKQVTLQDAPLESLGPKKRALKAGFEICTGEVVMTTDADSLPSSTWISRTVSCFDGETSAVCGLIRFEKPANFWGRLAAFEAGINAILNAAVIGLGGALSCFGANFAYRREAFLDAGGFDEGRHSISGDDDLLLQKLRSKGRSIRFCDCPGSTVRTRAPNSYRTYWSRKRRHLSAGRHYAAQWILLAAVIYLGCLSTVLIGVLAISGVEAGAFSWSGWGVLSLSLLLLYLRGTIRLRQPIALFWSIPAAVLFPLIFTLLQPLSLLPAPSWKGR